MAEYSTRPDSFIDTNRQEKNMWRNTERYWGSMSHWHLCDLVWLHTEKLLQLCAERESDLSLFQLTSADLHIKTAGLQMI